MNQRGEFVEEIEGTKGVLLESGYVDYAEFFSPIADDGVSNGKEW